MNLNQLKIFYCAARDGKLSSAADSLGISQPAVTKALQRLQQSLDLQLLERRRQRFVCTEAGEQLFEIAEEIFELDARADQLVAQWRGRNDETIIIDASLTFSDYYLPEVIQAFSSRYPETEPRVRVATTANVIAQVLSGAGDIAFTSYSTREPELRFTPLFREKIIVISPPQHQYAKYKYLSAEDFDGVTVLSHERGSAQQKILEEFTGGQVEPLFSPFVYPSNEAIKNAVIEGAGVALISAMAVEREVAGGVLNSTPLGPRGRDRCFYVATRRNIPLSAKCRNLLKLCEQIFDVNIL